MKSASPWCGLDTQLNAFHPFFIYIHVYIHFRWRNLRVAKPPEGRNLLVAKALGGETSDGELVWWRNLCKPVNRCKCMMLNITGNRHCGFIFIRG